jgi:hypothetical protein
MKIVFRYEVEKDADMGYDVNKEYVPANTFRYIFILSTKDYIYLIV